MKKIYKKPMIGNLKMAVHSKLLIVSGSGTMGARESSGDNDFDDDDY